MCLILLQASRTSGGVIVCPAKDLAGRSLQDQSFGSTIFCAYGFDLNCIYNLNTGDLMTDNDGGNCPSVAITPMPAPTGTPSSSAAPALSPRALMVAALLLVGFGFFELRGRVRRY